MAPNAVSRICALISAFAIIAPPWLILEAFTTHTRWGILTLIPAPSPSYSLAMVMGAWAFDFGPYSNAILPAVSIAALFFIVGAVISWWSPIGGVLQVGAVCALALSLAHSDFNLFRSELVEAEYSLGIGFYIGLSAALVTVFSLCPSGRSALIKAFRRTLKKARPRLS
ncbi:MAG: hypothetical protein JSV90_07755 [Methanobacteriota archaeon]|nr:MAG: hypothetical protein JSV90_07755 [Euryarchaeota archaeon]